MIQVTEQPGMIDFGTIADYFIAKGNESGELINNLKLNKLVYYAQAWHIAVCKQPLFVADFEAWIHGPVLPELFHQYSHLKYRPIEKDLGQEFITRTEATLPASTVELLADVVEEYLGMGGFWLERSMHTRHAEQPWIDARAGLMQDEPSTNIITKESMSEFYSKYTKTA